MQARTGLSVRSADVGLRGDWPVHDGPGLNLGNPEFEALLFSFLRSGLGCWTWGVCNIYNIHLYNGELQSTPRQRAIHTRGLYTICNFHTALDGMTHLTKPIEPTIYSSVHPCLHTNPKAPISPLTPPTSKQTTRSRPYI